MNGSKLSKVPIYTNLITPCPAIGDITNIEVWRSAKNKQRERKLNKRRTIVNSMYNTYWRHETGSVFRDGLWVPRVTMVLFEEGWPRRWLKETGQTSSVSGKVENRNKSPSSYIIKPPASSQNTLFFISVLQFWHQMTLPTVAFI